VLISDGRLTLTFGGGSDSRSDESVSAKGIKAAVSVIIDGGTLAINSADDGVHSNGSLVVNGGTLDIASGDDGMHADATLDIDDGVFNITDSYEGIGSAVITTSGGDIHVVSSDDGLNASTGNDGLGMAQGPIAGPGQGRGGVRGQPGAPGQVGFAGLGNCQLYIHGGFLVVDAGGDGIDVNGSVEMTDGVVIVNGLTENMNGPLDHLSFSITGGFLVAVGSSGMAQAPGQASSHNSALLNLNTAVRAGTLVHIQNKAGDDILTFAPTKQYQSVVLSSPDLIRGATYDVYFGGSATGTETDGLYQGGTYTAGTAYTSYTVSGVVSSLGGGVRR